MEKSDKKIYGNLVRLSCCDEIFVAARGVKKMTGDT